MIFFTTFSAHDVAEILEPTSHQSQIEGGVVMGIGYALREDLSIEEGQVGAVHLGDYKMSTMADTVGLRVELLKGKGKRGQVRRARSMGTHVTQKIKSMLGRRVPS